MRTHKITHPRGFIPTPQEKLALRNGQLLSWPDTLRQFQKLDRKGPSVEMRLEPNGSLIIDPPSGIYADKFLLFWTGSLFCRLNGNTYCAVECFPSVHIVQQDAKILISGSGGYYFFGSAKHPLSQLCDLSMVFFHEGKIHIVVADGRVCSNVISVSLSNSRDAWAMAALSFLRLVDRHSREKSDLLATWVREMEGGYPHA